MEDSRATSLAFVEANAEALGSSQRPERQEGPVRGRGRQVPHPRDQLQLIAGVLSSQLVSEDAPDSQPIAAMSCN
jgi:hypothetical protein